MQPDHHNILVVRFDGIGDVVLMSPFLRELRAVQPTAQITLLVRPEVANLVEQCPYVDRVLLFDARRASLLQRRFFAWRELRPQRFDLALLPRWDNDYWHASALLFYSGATRRVGYDEAVNERKQTRNHGYNRFFTDVLSTDDVQHEVERNLAVLRYLGWRARVGKLELWLTYADREQARMFFASRKVRGDTQLIAVCPGSFSGKRWPSDRFTALIERLAEQPQCQIVLIGGDQDRSWADEVARRFPTVILNAVDRTTLRETAALLERCHLYVGNDTGPMHMAAAVGTPVVEISGHTPQADPAGPLSPVRFGPWGVPHRVLRSHTNSVAVVSVDAVLQASQELLTLPVVQPIT